MPEALAIEATGPGATHAKSQSRSVGNSTSYHQAMCSRSQYDGSQAPDPTGRFECGLRLMIQEQPGLAITLQL